MGTWSMVPGFECFRRFVSFRCRACAAAVEAVLSKTDCGAVHKNMPSVDVLFQFLERDGGYRVHGTFCGSEAQVRASLMMRRLWPIVLISGQERRARLQTIHVRCTIVSHPPQVGTAIQTIPSCWLFIGFTSVNTFVLLPNLQLFLHQANAMSCNSLQHD